MKIKTTAKAIRECWGTKLAIDYCGAQFLLSNHAPVAYTCGVYGWNFDVYNVNSVIICTGYRGMVGKHVDYALLREYENRARAISESRTMPYEERRDAIEALLMEFLSKATN